MLKSYIYGTRSRGIDDVCRFVSSTLNCTLRKRTSDWMGDYYGTAAGSPVAVKVLPALDGEGYFHEPDYSRYAVIIRVSGEGEVPLLLGSETSNGWLDLLASRIARLGGIEETFKRPRDKPAGPVTDPPFPTHYR